MNTIYLIRDKATGLYWRGAKVRYSQVQRTAWTEAPAKARHFWQGDQVDRLFRGSTSGIDYEVVPFLMTEQPPREKDT